MNPIDLNADVGEGTGIEPLLAGLCSSWNVCCGHHAGSPDSLRLALDWACRAAIQVGAHPGHPDREHFGRREIPIDAAGLTQLLDDQVGALKIELDSFGLALSHLKLHGALYHQAAREDALAEAVARWAHRHGLIVFGPPHSRLEQACADWAPFAAEGFVDRGLLPDGGLIPRDRPGALIDDPDQAAAQALRLARSGRYRTLCAHGDTPAAASLLGRVRLVLLEAGHPILPPSP